MNDLKTLARKLLGAGLLAALFAHPSLSAENAEQTSDWSNDRLAAEIRKSPDSRPAIRGLSIKAQKGDKKARQVLKAAFRESDNKDTRREIAVQLVRLDEKDGIYWREVEARAKERIESDMPSLMAYDADGKAIRGKFNAEFLDWCKKRGLVPETMTEDALYKSQEDIMALMMTNDPRAIPLLMKGLDTKNHMVVILSVEGLAKLGHEAAVEKIIATCEKVPAEVASAMAQYLVFFKDPRASAAADRFIQDKSILDYRKKQAKEHNPRKLLEDFN